MGSDDWVTTFGGILLLVVIVIDLLAILLRRAYKRRWRMGLNLHQAWQRLRHRRPPVVEASASITMTQTLSVDARLVQVLPPADQAHQSVEEQVAALREMMNQLPAQHQAVMEREARLQEEIRAATGRLEGDIRHDREERERQDHLTTVLAWLTFPALVLGTVCTVWPEWIAEQLASRSSALAVAGLEAFAAAILVVLIELRLRRD